MKKIVTIAFCLLALIALHAQTPTEEADLNLIRTPQSPAFTLLGVQPSLVERPATPTDLIVSVGNASSGFSALPSNYALEIAPYYFFRKTKNEKLSPVKQAGETTAQKFRENFLKTGLLSFAAYKPDSVKSPQVAFGYKFSPFTGQLSNQDELHKKLSDYLKIFERAYSETKDNDALYQSLTKQRNDAASAKQKLTDVNEQTIKSLIDKLKATIKTLTDAGKTVDNDPLLLSLTIQQQNLEQQLSNKAAAISSYDLQIDALNKELENRQKELAAKSQNAEAAALLKEIEDMPVKLTGFKMDVAGGLAINFPTGKLDTATLIKYGVWTTLGWEDPKIWSIFFTARYTGNPYDTYSKDTTIGYRHYSSLDYGGRLIFDVVKTFSLSAEFLVRHNFAPQIKRDLAVRFMVNAEYAFMGNKVLSFNIGKDFKGGTSFKGNITAALNLVLGFGSTRKIPIQKEALDAVTNQLN